MSKYAIAVKYSDGKYGYLTGEEGKDRVFSSTEDAEKYKRKLMRTGDYHWNCEIFVTKWRKLPEEQ